MAKKTPPQFAKKGVKSAPVKGDKVAKGRMSAVQASKLKHSADAVLGNHDCSYHNV